MKKFINESLACDREVEHLDKFNSCKNIERKRLQTPDDLPLFLGKNGQGGGSSGMKGPDHFHQKKFQILYFCGVSNQKVESPKSE